MDWGTSGQTPPDIRKRSRQVALGLLPTRLRVVYPPPKIVYDLGYEVEVFRRRAISHYLVIRTGPHNSKHYCDTIRDLKQNASRTRNSSESRPFWVIWACLNKPKWLYAKQNTLGFTVVSRTDIVW